MAPGTFFVSISPLFLDPFGAEAGPGGGVWGAGGVKGVPENFQNWVQHTDGCL